MEHFILALFKKDCACDSLGCLAHDLCARAPLGCLAHDLCSLLNETSDLSCILT